MDIIKIIAKEFAMEQKLVKNIAELIDEGNTIPFIARYRKEMTGSCDDQKLRELADRLEYLRNLEKRKSEVLAALSDQEKLTPELEEAVGTAETLARLEDIYRPFKQKRRTRATVAREKGLEPLARLIFAQELQQGNVLEIAASYVDDEKGVATSEEAVAGARDIIAENLSDDAELRRILRELFWETGRIVTSAAAQAPKPKGPQDKGRDGGIYAMYFEYEEKADKLPSHRILAVNRGEREGFLKVELAADEDTAAFRLEQQAIKGPSIFKEMVREAAADGYKRLIRPSLEREIRSALTEKAGEQAMKNFGINLKNLLLQPPLKGKVVIGFDPAYRTGCKLAVIDPTGRVLDTDIIYPTPPQNRTAEAREALRELIFRYKADVIAIGNGTASKESEIFVAELLQEIPRQVSYVMVNEAGASVYSASPLAAREFPDYDVTLRSAVSIGRRLQDPLAELVKIDPKSVGVGQYQHDMPEAELDKTLAGVVEDCVNQVGVDLNTASPSLLAYIAGLSPTVAANVVDYREKNGSFHRRGQLLEVPKLGPKTYQQCAGFLRIPRGENVLDNTGVHPETYPAAEKLLTMFDYSVYDVGKKTLEKLPFEVRRTGEEKVASAVGVGVPTLQDMLGELLQPGRDLRDQLPPPVLRRDVMSLEDLKPGMAMRGTVRNVIDFGVFVDIGVHQDGLVHISQVADRFIRHPSEVVKVGDQVTVWVLAVDPAKKRISLSMRGPGKEGRQPGDK
ncbi:MAG: Tex family protein [Peptococcaceae bacterium]|nr:Tex family protein [Peptococcaceae bacterium]